MNLYKVELYGVIPVTVYVCARSFMEAEDKAKDMITVHDGVKSITAIASTENKTLAAS